MQAGLVMEKNGKEVEKFSFGPRPDASRCDLRMVKNELKKRSGDSYLALMASHYQRVCSVTEGVTGR